MPNESKMDKVNGAAITSRSRMVVTLEKLWAIFSHGCDQRRRERSGNKNEFEETKIKGLKRNNSLNSLNSLFKTKIEGLKRTNQFHP